MFLVPTDARARLRLRMAVVRHSERLRLPVKVNFADLSLDFVVINTGVERTKNVWHRGIPTKFALDVGDGTAVS